RVFDGAVKLQFAGLTPTLDDVSRDKIVVDTDNAIAAKITVETALAGDKGAATINYARDADAVSDGTLVGVNVSDSNNYKIHVIENASMQLYEKVLVNSGDKGRILQITAIGGGTSSTDKTTLQDVITGENFDFVTGVTNTTSRNIDGQTYFVDVKASGGTGQNVTINWGTGSSQGNPGSQTTLFPRIMTKKGGWFTILASTNVTNNTVYSLPGADSLTTYESGSALTYGNVSGNTTTVGKVGYHVVWQTTHSAEAYGISGRLSNLTLSTGNNCNFNATLGPAILFLEEKTATGSASTNGEAVCIPLTREGTTTVMPAVDAAVYSDGTTLATLQSATTRSQGVTTFGTLVERDTADNNKISLWYPDTQSIADVLFTSPDATVDSSTTGTTTGSGVKELGSVTVADSEAASVSDKNLIVVGGSCVNSVAASLLGGALCGADFESKTGVGAGSFLIQTFDRTGGKVATLVAGYNAGDTTNAAKYLTTQKLDVEKAGTMYKGTSATEATMTTEASSTENVTA
ncbi:hypothetical protein HYW75_03475, partial [Candidatus Pacearchaeota archaeon]|nr:hypothetical protein [Candidatus Pacearchaeota archaeon]